MSVRLSSSQPSEAPVVKGLHALGKALKFAESFVKVIAGVGAIGFMCLLLGIFGASSAASKIVFAQWTIEMALVAVFLVNLRLLVAEIDDQESGGVFGRSQGKRLRRMALAILTLSIAGFAFSFAAGFILEGGLPVLNVGAPLSGFPSHDDWTYALEGTYYPPNLQLVTIDASTLLFAGVLWALSYVFDYGAWLQEENEGVA